MIFEQKKKQYVDTLDDFAGTLKVIINELQGDDISLEEYPKNLPVGRPNELIPAKHLTVNWGDFELLEITEQYTYMELSQIDLDRNINRLRIHAIDFADITNEELISLLEKTVENIQGIAYYWATLSAEQKQILQKHKEGEEWLGGPFVSILTTQYYIEYLKGNLQIDQDKFDQENNSYKVFPNKFIENLTFPLLNAEVRFNKNMSFEQIKEFRGFSQRLGVDKKVTLVLGEGNVY